MTTWQSVAKKCCRAVEQDFGIRYIHCLTAISTFKCSTFSQILQIVQNTMNRTRIYVFLGTANALVEFMASMDTANLFSKGEYMVIFVDMMTYTPK